MNTPTRPMTRYALLALLTACGGPDPAPKPAPPPATAATTATTPTMDTAPAVAPGPQAPAVDSAALEELPGSRDELVKQAVAAVLAGDLPGYQALSFRLPVATKLCPKRFADKRQSVVMSTRKTAADVGLRLDACKKIDWTGATQGAVAGGTVKRDKQYCSEMVGWDDITVTMALADGRTAEILLDEPASTPDGSRWLLGRGPRCTVVGAAAEPAEVVP